MYKGASDIKTEINSPFMATISLIFIASLAFYLIAPTAFLDGDPSWHVAAGRYIVEHGRVPTSDPFSYTFFGRHWTAHEWLSELLMYAAFAFAGWSGVLLLFGISFATTIALVTSYSLRWLKPAWAACVSMFVVLLLSPRMFARPHVFSWLLLTLWVLTLLRARELSKAPNPAWGFLILIWANIHASYLFGLVLAGAFALEAVLEARPADRWGVVWGWCQFGLASLFCALITPSGPRGLAFPVTVTSMSSLSEIAEWQPTYFDGIQPLELALYAVLFLCLSRPVKVPLIRLSILIGVLHMAFSHRRFLDELALLWSLLLTPLLANAYSKDAMLVGSHYTPFRIQKWRDHQFLILPSVLLLTGVIVSRLCFPSEGPKDEIALRKALPNIPVSIRNGHVFNEYRLGGPLIYLGVPVFVDGRTDMYEENFVHEYFSIVNGSDINRFNILAEKWNFDWIVFSKDSPFSRLLSSQSNWKSIYSDDHIIIFIKNYNK